MLFAGKPFFTKENPAPAKLQKAAILALASIKHACRSLGATCFEVPGSSLLTVYSGSE